MPGEENKSYTTIDTTNFLTDALINMANSDTSTAKLQQTAQPQPLQNIEMSKQLPTTSTHTQQQITQIPHNNARDLVYTVNLQLPQFNPQSPDLWFAIAEADFTANRISSDGQKYVQILKALPFQIAEQIKDVINYPPAQDKYMILKNTILDRFSTSRKKQLQKLLSEKVGGDKKPSQILREMRALAQNSVNDEVLHQLWSERLPTRVRPLLIISESLGLNALAEMADRLVDELDLLPVMAVHNQDTNHYARRSHNPAGATHIERQLTEINSTLQTIQNNLTTLQSCQQTTQKQIYDMQTHQQQQHQTINALQQQLRQRNRSHSRQRQSTPTRSGMCYYHTRWGNEAHRCNIPCTFSTSASNNQGN